MLKNRNLQIEGLRGIAILMVVIYHVFCRYRQIYINENIEWMQNFGAYAVNLFFLMSGYFFNKDTTILKKIFRLWPSYVVAVFFSVVLLEFFPLPNKNLSCIQIVTNIFFLNVFFKIPYVDGAHWFIHTLIILFLVASVLKSQKIYFFFIWLSLIATFSFLFDNKISHILFHLMGGQYACCFICGIAIKRIKEKNWIYIIILGVAEIFILQGVLFGSVFIITVFLFFQCIKGNVRLLEAKILTSLGLISFPLYVIHQNLAYVIEFYFFPSNMFFFGGVVSCLVCVFFACVIQKFVEQKRTWFYDVIADFAVRFYFHPR